MTFKNLISFNLFFVSLLFNFAHANITYKLDEARNLFNKKKYEEAYEIYIELVQNKVPEAEHYIALFQCYGTIKSIKKDDKKCVSKLEELANNGYIESQFELGVFYHYEKQNYEKAIESYKKSANKGHKNSIYNLAVLYGELGFTDKALDTYKRNKGHGMSYYNLGRFYSTDEYNVPQDYEQSLYYFSLALPFSPFSTPGGLAHVENSLGFLFEGKSDVQKAHDIYLVAAKKNDGIAAYNLGRLYFGSMPLFKEINHETAYHLFKLAEKNSNDTAKSMLDFKYFYDLLDKKLTNEFKNRASTISDHNFILKNIEENIVYTRNDLISHIQKLQYAQDYSPDNLNNNSTFESELNYIGNIYALLIGVNDYDDQQLDTLQSPINDITLIEKTLKNNFNFNVEKLINPKRSEITKKLNKLKNKLSPDDSLIIYFAGHGKKLENEGFWLPSDAEINDDTNWISNEYITRKIKSYSARNILVIADSCYSGTLTREAPNFEVNPDFKAMQSFLTTKTRLVLSSGGDSPILDNSGNGNSIFANIFNKSLSEQKNPFTISEIYTKLAKNIVRISEELGLIQTPLLSPIFKSGHEAPDFVFIPKSK